MNKLIFAVLFLSVFGVFATADAIKGDVYPDPACSAASGTVLDPAKPGDLAIADILLKNDQPFLYVPENLCTAAKVFIVATDAKAKALAQKQGKANPEDVKFDVELHFRDTNTGFTGIPLKLTDVSLHKLEAKSPFKTLGQGANQKTYDWGGFTQVVGTPKYLSFLGIGKGTKDGNAYKVVAVLKLKDDQSPLLCRYWYHAQGTDNTQSGVLKIVSDDLQTIYSTSETPTNVRDSPQLQAARAAYSQFKALSSTDPAYKQSAERFVNAYLAFLKFEAENGNSNIFLTPDQRAAAIALAKDPLYHKALIAGLTEPFVQVSSQTVQENQKDRLLRYLTHYREVVRAAVELRRLSMQAIIEQSNDKTWFTKYVPSLKQLADEWAGKQYQQTYEIKESTFPRTVIRDEDSVYNILAEQYAQERERLAAVELLLELVKDGTIKPADLPQPNEINAINANGLDRSTQRFAAIKRTAIVGSKAGNLFADRRNEQITEKRDNGDVTAFGTFLPYSAIIQKDFRVDPRMQAMLYAALVTDETRKPVYESTYELKTIGSPTGPNDASGKPTRVGGYLKGEVANAYFKALEAGKLQYDETWYAGGARFLGTYTDLLMAIPLSPLISGLGKAATFVGSKIGSKATFLRVTGPAAASVAEAHSVFRGATVAPKAAVAGLEAGKSYVVEEVLEEGGKRVVRLAEGATTGSGKAVTMGIEEFEALARAGQVTLAKEGTAALTGLSKAGSQSVEKGAENLARTPSNLARKVMDPLKEWYRTTGSKPLSEFKFFQNKVFTNAFSRAIGKTIQYVTQTASRPVGDVFKGAWGKFTGSGVGSRLSSAFKRGPAAVNTEIQAQKAAGNALVAETASGEKILLEGAEAAGGAVGRTVVFDEVLQAASGKFPAGFSTWDEYVASLKGAKIKITRHVEVPGSQGTEGVLTGGVGVKGAPTETSLMYEVTLPNGKTELRKFTVNPNKAGGSNTFEIIQSPAAGTAAGAVARASAPEAESVWRAFLGKKASLQDLQSLVGQRVKVVAKGRGNTVFPNGPNLEGEVRTITGVTSDGKLKYSVETAGPKAPERMTLNKGGPATGDFDAFGAEVYDIQLVTSAGTVVSSTTSGALPRVVFEDALAAVKNGPEAWKAFVEANIGRRIRITASSGAPGAVGREGVIEGISTNKLGLTYRAEDGKLYTVTVNPKPQGLGHEFEFIDNVAIAASSSSAESAWAAFAAGKADSSALKGLIGRQLKPTTGALYSFGEVWEVVGVEGQKIRYRVIQSRAPTQTVGSEALLDASGIRWNKVELVPVAAGDDVVLTGRRIPVGVNPVQVAAAAAGGPPALAAAHAALGPLAQIPASAVRNIRLLPTYKGSQFLILGFLHPDTQKVIPQDVTIPPLQVTSTTKFSLEVGKACEGALDGGSVGTVVQPVAPAEPAPSTDLLTLNEGASCGSGRGTCTAQDVCKNTVILPVSGTDPQRAWCKPSLVCCQLNPA